MFILGLFKSKANENWKINYIKEFNQMRADYEKARSNYEKKLKIKQDEIDELKKEMIALKQEIDKLNSLKSNLRPKEKQIRDKDIMSIKELRKKGLSYREISQKTSWSKATVCRVMKGAYD